MKRIICFLLFTVLLNGVYAAKNSVDTAPKQATTEASQPQISTQQNKIISSLSVKEIERLTGRKLSFKEKIGWFFLKKQTRKHNHKEGGTDKKQNDNAVLGFVLSLLGLLVFPLLAIPGFILSNNAMSAEKEYPGTLTKSNYDLAKAGRTISIITGILLILGLIAIAIIIASLGR